MYLDDCIVSGKDEAEFLTNLKNVFEIFRLKGLRLKTKKCRFGLPRIEYVGRVVDEDGLSMSKEKIETVLNFSIDIRLYIDASDFGIGGVLFQVVGAIWQSIAFISKSLTPTQIRWSTIQKEAYAIFYCCTQLDYLIRDRTFTIPTDHLNITYMKQNPTLMVARWFIAMQELHFTVVFVPGTSNVLADALSRLCPNLTESALPLRTEELELLPTSSCSFTVSALTVIEPATDDQLEYIQMCHNAIVGHNGVDRTLTRLFSLQQVWKHMKQHVRTFIQNRPCCQ